MPSLYEEVMNARSQGIPKKVNELTKKLELIASKLNLDVNSLLEKAEHSPEFREEYLAAKTLARQIAHLKK